MNKPPLIIVLASNLAVGLTCYWLGSQPSRQNVSDLVKQESVSILHSNHVTDPLSLKGRPTIFETPKKVDFSRLSKSGKTVGLRQRLASLMGRVETMDDQEVLANLKKIRHQPDSPDRQLAQQVLMARYGELDPETALTYVETLVGDEYREAGLTVMNAWTNAAPEAAAAHFQDNLDSFGIIDSHQRSIAGAVASEWARTDPNAALNWAASLPPEISGEAYGRIVSEMVQQDPAQATAALNTLDASYERTEMLGTLVSQWAYQDPQNAADWMINNTSGNDQLSAVTSLVDAWMTTDPMTASTWVSRLDSGAVKDNAIIALTQSRAVSRDPEAATAWRSTIQNASLR